MTATSRWSRRAAAVYCLSLLTGCVGEIADERDGEEALSTSQQALGWVGVGTWGCVGDCADWDLGSYANQTCILTGVRGNLSASARVVLDRRRDGHYWLDVRNNQSNALMADIACIGTTLNRTGEFLKFGNGTTTIPAGTSARRCFLTSIVTNAAPANAFSNTANYARVYKNLNGTWSLVNSQSTSPYASAHIGATCVDVPTLVAAGFDQAPDPGFDSLQITAAFSSTNDTVCGLTGIGGRFNTNDYEDNSRLYRADYSSTGGGYKWWLFTDNGKRGWYTCVK
jgi:hypothetical protein